MLSCLIFMVYVLGWYIVSTDVKPETATDSFLSFTWPLSIPITLILILLQLCYKKIVPK